MSNQKGLSLRANFLWNTFGTLFFLGCQYCINIFTIKATPDLFIPGILALSVTISNLLGSLGYFRIRAFQVSDEKGEYTLGIYVAHRFLTIALHLLATVIYILAFGQTEHALSIMLYSLFVDTLIMSDVLYGAEQAANRMDYIGKSFILKGTFMLPAYFGTLVLTNSPDLAFIALFAASALVIFLIDIPSCKKLNLSLKPEWRWPDLLKLTRAQAPSVIGVMLTNIAIALPRQELANIAGTDVLGIYATIAAPITVLQMGASFIYTPVLGTFANHVSAGDKHAFYQLFIKVTAIILGGIIVLGAILVAGAPWFLQTLFGEVLASHADIVAPLVISCGVTAFTWLLSDLVIVVRDLNANMIAFIISSVLTVLLADPLIYQLGMNGVSWCLSLSYAVALVILLVRMIVRVRAL